jgi:acyl-CoA reductase-like NAD-dependent aldehyde dehydrogenase
MNGVQVSDAAWIDNRRHRCAGETLELVDPSTGMPFGSMAGATETDVDAAVASAKSASAGWKRSTPLERSRACRRISDLILDHREVLASTIVDDAGLPLTLAQRDVETAARYFEFYAGLPDKLFGESIPVGPSAVDFTVREPWGVCAIVLPFNFPLQLAARDLAPAVATGNTVVLKPPEQAPLAALALAELCKDAGLPPGVVNAVTGLGSEAGAALVASADVDHITFTGSAATARHVLAAAAQNFTPAIIELGGKSPHVVFSDADLQRVVDSVVATTFRSAGQACSAGTRLLVESGVHGPLVELLVSALGNLRTGPARDDPDVGPLISGPQRDNVLAAIRAGEAAGAHVVIGGAPPTDGIAPRGGFFVEPTVLDNVAPNSPPGRDEIFGPVLAVTPFESEQEAIDLANGTEFGLVAGVWTADVGRAHRVASSIDAGQIFVNSYGVGGGVELPFGGYKSSGYGRVKGVPGAVAYTQLKNVCIAFE